MARGRKRVRKNPAGESEPVPREEQGDLLTGAVHEEAARPTGRPGEADPSESSEPEAPTSEPGEPNESGEEAAETTRPVEEAVKEGEEESREDPERTEAEVEASGPTIPDSPWEQKLAWAKERVQDGRREDALELYRELVEEDPSSVRALNNLGILLDEMGQHAEAAGLIKDARFTSFDASIDIDATSQNSIGA